MQDLIQPSYPGVSSHEMAFAMALFVGAGNGRISPHRHTDSQADRNDELQAHRRFVAWSSQTEVANAGPLQRKASVSLFRAFLVVWQHYGLEECQQSICARLIGFYYMMERTRGEVLAAWTRESPVDPESIILHPAVVETIANIELTDAGCFSEALLLTRIASLVADDLAEEAAQGVSLQTEERGIFVSGSAQLANDANFESSADERAFPS